MKLVTTCLLAAFATLAAQQTAAPGTHLKIGDKAPDFTMRDQNRKTVKLSDYKDKTVVLAFYVLAFTGG